MDDLKGFVAEHAEVPRGLAKVMRVVGIALVAVGAVLAVFGVGTVVLTAGFVLWAPATPRGDRRLGRGQDHGQAAAVPCLPPEAVRDHARRIGHDLTPNRARDQSWRPDGWPGRYQASHAEKQQALSAPDHPIAVSKPMCRDCREFFRRQAIHTGRPQVVTDPDGTRLFHPDGRIIPNPGPKDFGPAPPMSPQPPTSPDLSRDGALVGAAAGADAGWELTGTRAGER